MWTTLRYRIQLARLFWQQGMVVFALRMLIIMIGLALRTGEWLGRTVLGIHRMCWVVN